LLMAISFLFSLYKNRFTEIISPCKEEFVKNKNSVSEEQ
jgi:hypothetical protein